MFYKIVMKNSVLRVKEIPVPRSSCHEMPKHDVLPSHEFTLGLIAPKGCGKTTMICNLLEFYKGNPGV
jgi:ABC-type branched-subunit amino acid transport system ATPase component